jgi:flagellar hook-associated protein 1 FlgK
MSLVSALNIGSTALAVAQAQIQTTGNNIANAGNANYTRETTTLADNSEQQIEPGVFLGTGVDLTGVQRQVDSALTARVNSAVSDNQSANTTSQWIGQVQSTFNALSGSDLSSQMSTFYNDWSALANNPADSGQRQVVLQDGAAVASTFQNLQGQLGGIQDSVQNTLASQVTSADQLATQIASLNGQIVTAQGGTAGTANSLLDQRDAAVQSLSQLMDVTTVQEPSGSLDVYVGSEPLVSGSTSYGVEEQSQVVNGKTVATAAFKSDGETMDITSGQIGALESVQGQVGTVQDQLNTLASNLIFSLNKLHSSGQGTAGFSSVTSTNAVTDPTQPLDSTAAGLAFTPTNGSFVVHVTDPTTGLQKSTLVQVNLTGQPTDTTLNSLAASLSGITGVTATVSGGRLTIAASNPNQQITFSQDSSGVLAALGINTFFTGKDASTIAVNPVLTNQPTLLAAAQNGDPADNQTALAIAALGSQPIAALQGQSLDATYQSMINGISVSAASAQSNAQATLTVQNTLQAQKSAVSGVSLDEETVNLMQQQTAYQGAAKLISVVDDMMQTLMAMVIY